MPGTYYTIVIDRLGRIVYAHVAPDSHWTLYVTVDPITKDHIIWDESTKWSDLDGGDASVLHRAYLDEPIETIPAKGLHHEWVELPDGTLAWGSQSADDSDTEALVELAPGASSTTILWTCEDDWPGSGVCESNGLFYDAPSDTYVYSFYTNNSLARIDRSSGNTLWSAGSISGSYAFDPEESQFSWQHGVSITEDGNLLLSTKSDAHMTSGLTTVVREYEIDDASNTLTNVWTCDPGVRALTNGDAWRLPNGNTLHVVGSAGVIVEYQPDCTIVWRADFEDDYLLGRGEFIEDLYTLVAP
jgi:hypothetical protein